MKNDKWFYFKEQDNLIFLITSDKDIYADFEGDEYSCSYSLSPKFRKIFENYKNQYGPLFIENFTKEIAQILIKNNYKQLSKLEINFI